jgi:hypothetical protein
VGNRAAGSQPAGLVAGEPQGLRSIAVADMLLTGYLSFGLPRRGAAKLSGLVVGHVLKVGFKPARLWTLDDTVALHTAFRASTAPTNSQPAPTNSQASREPKVQNL